MATATEGAEVDWIRCRYVYWESVDFLHVNISYNVK